jgi:hypothetical protein
MESLIASRDNGARFIFEFLAGIRELVQWRFIGSPRAKIGPVSKSQVVGADVERAGRGCRRL